ncbi:MAG: hypothetical protein QOJ19_4017 [Acidimicrobiia bacterium]|nr:hypothetical protein [Acidimicrobiia bacterium]
MTAGAAPERPLFSSLRGRVTTALRPARTRSAARRRAAVQRELAARPVLELCPVCAGPGAWSWRPVISSLLATQWRLSSRERAVLDVQQGHSCTRCGLTLRARALARALLDVVEQASPLSAGLASVPDLRVLEINPAGGLSSHLAAAAVHVQTSYPEVDMERLPYADGSFDLVVHSDTLEHVADAEQGIRECLRVAGRGWVVFTTPVLPGRVSRLRGQWASRSYHGGDGSRSLVFHEFGGDIWTIPAAAGATEVRLHVSDHPYALVISCRRSVATEGAGAA